VEYTKLITITENRNNEKYFFINGYISIY